MRLTLHWRGKPLVALDLSAQSPDEPEQGPILQAAGTLQDSERSESPDTYVIGFAPTREEAS